jgi:hypothetical protein
MRKIMENNEQYIYNWSEIIHRLNMSDEMIARQLKKHGVAIGRGGIQQMRLNNTREPRYSVGVALLELTRHKSV